MCVLCARVLFRGVVCFACVCVSALGKFWSWFKGVWVPELKRLPTCRRGGRSLTGASAISQFSGVLWYLQCPGYENLFEPDVQGLMVAKAARVFVLRVVKPRSWFFPAVGQLPSKTRSPQPTNFLLQRQKIGRASSCLFPKLEGVASLWLVFCLPKAGCPQCTACGIRVLPDLGL